jgi:hypothetical protein
MPHRLCRLAGTAFAAVLLAGALEPAATPGGAAPAACAAQAADGPEPRPHCCFTNARYVGTCEVEPSKDETCATILQYLNNPQSQGKSYCNATSVRGGWKQVPCQPKDAGD